MAAPPIANTANTDQQQQQQTTHTPQHIYHQSHFGRQISAQVCENSVTSQAPALFIPMTKPNSCSSTTTAPQVQAVQQQTTTKQPEFVVFELFGQQKQQLNSSHRQLLNVHQQQQQQKFATKWTPFSPLMSLNSREAPSLSNNIETETNVEESSAVAPTSSNGICFATVHLWPNHPSLSNNNSSSSNINIVSRHSKTPQQQRTNRLLFDNPMFRRLPNWHFFGDDRRLVPIPPLIPLLPVMPIERTLLYIAPNESSSRQLLLLAMLDMKRKKEIAGGMPAIGDGEADSESAETAAVAELPQQDDELLPVEQECPSSTSGVESMSSAEESGSALTERSSRSTTPTNKGGRSTPGEQLTEPKYQQNNAHEYEGGERQDGNEMEEYDEEDEMLRLDQQHNHLLRRQSPISSATESCTSSTPNSPPTFDRRIVRMSRGTRDAVRRLSRRFEEDREEEEEEAEEEESGNCAAEDESDVHEFALSQSRFPSVASLAPPTVLMMSTAGQTPVHRSRHCSAGSNSAQPNNSHEAISRMDVLSERIRDFHYNEDQTHAQLNRKLQLRDQLYYAISPIFPMCGLYIVGSSLNGFGTKRSDLDLCLMITNRDIDQRTDAVVVLSSVMRTLESNQIVAEQNLILAKVPILRIKFIGTFHDITVDLNVNNSVAIRNTHLMCYYSSFDWRVRPLVMVVKEWAKRHGINDSACSSFTSYSLVLMVIHYLQCGAQPPVLPNLQQMYPKRFSVRADVRTLNVSLPFEPIPTAMGWQFKDDATLSELLLGFLRYYAFQFDFDADAISIRMGKKVNRAQVAQNQSPFNTLSQWHCICIEEPFTLSNAAHSVYDERIFQDIKKAFVDSYRELDKHRDLDRFLGPTVEASTAPLGQ